MRSRKELRPEMGGCRSAEAVEVKSAPRSRLAVFILCLAAALASCAALAQGGVPRIWDIPLGTHVRDLPGRVVQEAEASARLVPLADDGERRIYRLRPE